MSTKTNVKEYCRLLLMLTLTLGTQLFIVIKSSRVAAIFGTGIEMDAYNFINNIATFIFSFIAAGVSTVLIPYMVRNDANKARDGFITIVYCASAVIMGMFYIFRYPILELFGNESDLFVEVAESLIIVIFVGQLLTSINSTTTAYLQCKNDFNLSKTLALLVTILMTVVVFCCSDLNIQKYAIFTALFLLAEMIVQLFYATKKGFDFRVTFSLRDPELSQMFKIFWPTVLGSGVYQITLLTDSFLSSFAGQGNLSILSYSNMISNMVNTVIAGNLMLYIYPKIAKEAGEQEGKNNVFQYMNLFSALMCGVVILFYAAGYDAIRFLFERGAFTEFATKSVFLCAMIYIVGAPINLMRDIMYRFFYSMGNTKSTFYNGLFASIVNIVVSIILAKWLGLYGIVLGTTITAIFSFGSILIRMNTEYSFDGYFSGFMRELLKVAMSTIAAIAGCFVLKTMVVNDNNLWVSLVEALVGCLIYIACLKLTRSKSFDVQLG